MYNLKKITAAFIISTVTMFTVTGCTLPWSKSNADSTNDTTTAASNGEELAATAESELTLTFDDEDLFAAWDTQASSTITLNGTGASSIGAGVNVNGQTVTITSTGTYVISGKLTDGCINVNVAEKGTVRLVLNGVDITSTTTAPILVTDAKKVLVTVAEGTTNTVTDNSRSTTESEDYSAAIYSKADLVFNGTGILNVNAGYRNGIKSNDDLKFVSGNIVINSAEDGIVGKDLLGVKDGSFTITAGSDAMKSTYDKDTSKGNIILNGGTYDLTAVNDGAQAQNILVINGGTYNIKTGGGADNASSSVNGNNDWGAFGNRWGGTTATITTDTESMKGIKAANSIYVYTGNLNFDCEDDGVHSDGSIYIEGGTFRIKAGDDGIHADISLTVNAGNLDIQKSYEGLESQTITINGGDISIVASDDGINAASGSDSTSGQPMGGFGGNASASNNELIINGGNSFINAGGDGLDANGNITINGGYVIVEGPTDNSNTAVDFDGSCTLNGGTLMAFGSNGMLETPTSAANGCCIVSTFSSIAANSKYTLSDESGKELLSYTPSKIYSAAIVYSADISQGSTYTVTAGSSSSSVTVSSGVTGGASGMGGGMQPGGQQGGQPGGMDSGMKPEGMR